VTTDLISRKCRRCGKEISVLHPAQWAFKKVSGMNVTYWCSWTCLRKDEKEGKFDMRKLTLEDKKEAVRIALSGGNPLDYIRMCGISNAAEAWSKIKEDLKKKDPEAWARLPKRVPTTKTEEVPSDEVTKAVMAHPEQPIVQIEGPVVMEPKERDDKGNTKPFSFQGFDVSAVRHPVFGEFYYDKKFKCVDWRAPDGAETSLSPELWRELAEQIPGILDILGANDNGAG